MVSALVENRREPSWEIGSDCLKDGVVTRHGLGKHSAELVEVKSLTIIDDRWHKVVGRCLTECLIAVFLWARAAARVQARGSDVVHLYTVTYTVEWRNVACIPRGAPSLHGPTSAAQYHTNIQISSFKFIILETMEDLFWKNYIYIWLFKSFL